MLRLTALSSHPHQCDKREVEVSGGSLQITTANISCHCTHHRSSINKCWLCLTPSFTRVRRWRRRWGGWKKEVLHHRIHPLPKITLFSMTFKWGLFFLLWKESKWLKNKSHECSACFIIRRHTAEHLHKQRQRCRPAEERFTCTRHRGPEWVQISGFLLDLGLYTFAFESRTGSTNNEKPTEVVENGCKLRRPPT